MNYRHIPVIAVELLSGTKKTLVLYSPLSFVTVHRVEFNLWAQGFGKVKQQVIMLFHGLEFDQVGLQSNRIVKKDVVAIDLESLYKILEHHSPPEDYSSAAGKIIRAMAAGSEERGENANYGHRSNRRAGQAQNSSKLIDCTLYIKL